MAKDPTWDKLILQVLEEKKTKMRYDEIADEIVNRNLRSSVGATPAVTVNSYLHSDKLKDKVTCIERGVYILTKHLNENPQSAFSTPTQSLDNDPDSDVSDALITSYGRFWERQLWENNNYSLLGKNIKTPKAKGVKFDEYSGIYLLHKGYEVVYVGQAQQINSRLLDHTKDSLRNRWDNFSWFCIDELECNNENFKPSDIKSLANEALLDTLEALLIETLGPERNKKVGNGFEDKEFEQVSAVNFL